MSAIGTDRLCRLVSKHVRSWRLTGGVAARPILLSLCRFLEAGNNQGLGTLSGQASKKRQGTKSREVGPRLGSEAMGI